MKIVVAGASGYIGTELCRHLSADAPVAEIVNVDVAAPRGALHRRRLHATRLAACRHE